MAVFHLAEIEGPLRLRKLEGVLQERWSAGLPSCILPVVADVKEWSGMLHQGRRGRAESEILGLGCTVFGVYHQGQGAVSP